MYSTYKKVIHVLRELYVCNDLMPFLSVKNLCLNFYGHIDGNPL